MNPVKLHPVSILFFLIWTTIGYASGTSKPFPKPESYLETVPITNGHLFENSGVDELGFHEVTPDFVPDEDRPFSCFVSAPFRTKKTITLLVQGGADPSGISFWIESDSEPQSREVYELRIVDIHYYDWRICKWDLPTRFRNQDIRMHVGLLPGRCYPQGLRFSDPLESKNLRLAIIGSWKVSSQYLLYGLLFAFLIIITGYPLLLLLEPHYNHLPLLKFPLFIFSSLLVHYLVFWVFFYKAYLGWWIVAAIHIAALTCMVFRGEKLWKSIRDSDFRISLFLWFFAYFFVLSGGMIDGGWEHPIETAAERYLDIPLPADNYLPALLAERITEHFSVHPYFMDSQSSDRPPLQTATFMAMQTLVSQNEIQYMILSVLLQSLLMPCVYLFVRSFGNSGPWAVMIALSCFFTGNFLVHGFYTWPKLLPAALLILIVMLLYSRDFEKEVYHNKAVMFLIGGLTALSMLSHGGSFFALLPIFLIWLIPDPIRRLRVGILCFVPFLLLMLPWMLYQKLYDPPGDHMLKWHLAGYIYPTDESLLNILRQQYAALTFAEWWDGKVKNLITIFGLTPAIPAVLNQHPLFEGFSHLRSILFYSLVPSIGIWNIGMLLLPFNFARHKSHIGFPAIVFAMNFSGIILWILLMFIPGSTAIHHGTLLFPILTTLLMADTIRKTNPYAFITVSLLNLLLLLFVWILPPPLQQIAPNTLNNTPYIDVPALIFMAVSVLILMLTIYDSRQLKGLPKHPFADESC